MAYTTTTAVGSLLGSGAGGNWDGVTDLQQYIDSAHVVVGRTITCAASKGITFSNSELEMIERWLAAHYYTKFDPTYQTKSTGGASGNFIRNKDEMEPYKDGAINMDYSGCLKAILHRQFASAFSGESRPAGSVSREGRL